MNSQMFFGTVWHRREEPRVYAFRYPMMTFGLDLSELPTLGTWWPLFGYNRRAVLSIHDKDYLCHLTGRLPDKLRRVLADTLGLPPPARTALVTMPRMFGYVFNPVSFYVSWAEDGSIHSILVEVNNTFGETHIYPLKPERPNSQLPLTFEAPKRFFVSPFFDPQGTYHFTMSACDSAFVVELTLVKGSRQIFAAKLSADGRSITFPGLAGAILRNPLSIWLSIPRIQWQALGLYLRGKVSVFRKPEPTDPHTIRSRQGLMHRLRLKVLECMER